METKTYRGRTLEEILPQIKRELGPDAVITRQRNGLTGGVAGFFQRECIEVDAHAPEPAFDAYDDDAAATPEPEPDFVPDPLPPQAATSEGLNARAIQELLESSAPFGTADPDPAPQGYQPFSAPAEPADPGPARFSEHLSLAAREPGALPPAAQAIETRLVAAGIDPSLASRIVGDVVTHQLPFANPRSLKRLVRAALADRIPTASASGGSRSLAFVGPGGAGKTLCAARVAAAYAGAGQLRVVCVALRPPDGGAELRSLLAQSGIDALVTRTGAQARALLDGERERSAVVVDTPAVSARTGDGVDELAADLAALELDEVHLTIPASSSGPAARSLLDGRAPLGLAAMTLTHTDDSTDVGGVVDTAIATATALSYLSAVGGLEPARADGLAAWVLP